MEETFMLTGEAAKVLDRGTEVVRYYERLGRLKAIRTPSGYRIYRLSDVEALAVQLQAKGRKSGQ